MDFEVGHILAVSNGGNDEISNLRPICSVCNKSMGSKNMREYVLDNGFFF
jgi:5-methylcytosine-specific restriction endonuclease McrA